MLSLRSSLAFILLALQNACAGSESICLPASVTVLTFDLAEKGINISTVTDMEWKFHGVSSSPLTMAILAGPSFIVDLNYTGRIERTSSLSASLNLTLPTKADEGTYTCTVVHGAALTTQLTDYNLTVLAPPSPDNLILSLSYDVDQATLNCSGPSDVGDAKLVVARDDTSTVLAEESSITLTVLFSRSTADVVCSCYLTGPAARCINVGANGVVTVPGCRCPCPCVCSTANGLVIVLALLTCALIAVVSAVWGTQVDISAPGLRRWILVIVIVSLICCVVAFLFAVGFMTVSGERKCANEECRQNPCCTNAHCPETYKASIAFLAIGSAAVIYAIVTLVIKCCCPSRPSLGPDPGPAPGPPPGPARDPAPGPIPNPLIPLTEKNGMEKLHSEKLLSPKPQLSPLDRQENTDTDQPSSKKKKKKKTKKDQPESEELRPLPTPSQPPPETQRRPSTDVHVNMSGSNNSSLPIRSTFNPGQQTVRQGESAMPSVESSSLKRN